MLNFRSAKNIFSGSQNKNKSVEGEGDKIPTLSGERDADSAGIIAGNMAEDLSTKQGSESLPFKPESDINVPKVPYSSPLQEAYRKHDESLAKYKKSSLEQDDSKLSKQSPRDALGEFQDKFESLDKIKDNVKQSNSTTGFKESSLKNSFKNNTEEKNDVQSLQTTEESVKPKASVMTMLADIESKAGEEEKNKWQKRLEKEKKLIQNKKKIIDPNSPEAILEKQFAKNESLRNVANAMSQEKSNQAEVKTYKPLSVRTFKSDLQNLMQKDKLSLTKIVAIESDRRKYNKENQKIKKEKHYSYFAFAILGIAVLLTLSLLSYAAYLQYHSENAPSAIDNLANQEVSLLNPLIFIEDKIRIDISDKPRIYILRVLQAARDSGKISTALGNVTEFELVKKYQNKYYKISSKEMLAILNPHADDIFKESLKSQYMIGVHIDDKGRQSFAIFTINSYQFVFAAMLNWEKTIEQDAGIFLDPKYRTAYASAFDSEETFKDAVLKNYSVRVLYDKNGKIKLLYGFIGQDTLIITSSAKTFLELAARIAVEKGQ